ncbi:hypothetical protein BC940DRAFT_298972 [Gongronella butleri]|nr:hypothetical protein BC940DRAFT_298972 [Gongronella butleri]
MVLNFSAATPEGTSRVELVQELQDILGAFCSTSQQQFCVDQGVFRENELLAWRNTMQAIHALLPTLEFDTSPEQEEMTTSHVRRSLIWTLQDVVQGFDTACAQRAMSPLDELQTNQYIDDWHRLKRQMDSKSAENELLGALLDEVSRIARVWLPLDAPSPVPSTSISKRINQATKKMVIPSKKKKNYPLARSTTHPSAGPVVHAPTSPLGSSIMGPMGAMGAMMHHPWQDLLFRRGHTAPTTPLSSAASGSMGNSTVHPADDVLTSILTTFDYPPGAYMVSIDRVNYAQLGMDHAHVGTRQIIFDTHYISPSDAISLMTRLCDMFTALFSSTAQQHLAQVDAQVRKAQPYYTASHLKRLSSRLLMTPPSSVPSDDDDDDGSPPPIPVHRHPHRVSAPPASTAYSAPPLSSRLAHTKALAPFRLSLTTPHMLWHHPIPIPSFAPAPWQLPSLMKPRYPYDALFFGLIRRKPHRAAKFLWHIDHDTSFHGPDHVLSAAASSTASDDAPPQRNRPSRNQTTQLWAPWDPEMDVPPFFSVSVAKLALHLGKISAQFYRDVAAHTRLRHQENAQTLDTLDWEMTDVYRHLQLASARAVMHRALQIALYLHPACAAPDPASQLTFPPPPNTQPPPNGQIEQNTTDSSPPPLPPAPPIHHHHHDHDDRNPTTTMPGATHMQHASSQPNTTSTSTNNHSSCTIPNTDDQLHGKPLARRHSVDSPTHHDTVTMHP